MTGTGTGPSRRSHTKSRKGCKTCKRRHIRCDETFPQCRNCTKHQVRCDYMDSVGSDVESQQQSPERPSLVLTPSSESRVDLWQQTGNFPYPDLQVFPPPQTHEYSKNELRLLHHLSTVSNELLLKGTSNLTLWTQKMPKFLSIASSFPYVMHGLLAFSANHLAWTHSSSEARNLYLHHGSIALRGLHEAIGNFSRTNADAILAASLLLLWQATDWRSWSSLRAGTQSVVSAMQYWNHDSAFAAYIAEEDLLAWSFRSRPRRPSISLADRAAVFQNVIFSLHKLQLSLVGQDMELSWVEQLVAYMQQLQNLDPVQTSEEQFKGLYLLRKWLFWVPISLLRRQSGQGPALLTLAHFYATALALEPLFPDLGSSFCSVLAMYPLEDIITVTDAVQTEPGMGFSAIEIASIMQFPKQVADGYQKRAMHERESALQRDAASMLAVDTETLGYTKMGNMSPAFSPSALHYGDPSSSSSSTSALPPSFLEVPPDRHASSFTDGTQSWGTIPSPRLLAQAYPKAAEEPAYSLGGGGTALVDARGGFVAPPSTWA